MDDLYNVIRNIRAQRGYSQEYMAEKLGMNQSSYAKLEKGGTQLTVERLKQIAATFGLPVNYFLAEPKADAASVASNTKVEELQQRISELEEQLLDKRRMIDAIKSTFKMEVNRLYATIPGRYEVTIATLDEARQYADKYNEPELLKQFEAAATEENGKKTHHPIGFLTPEAREQAEALIFEELRPYFMFFDLHLIDEELEDNFNLTEKWKKYVRRNQDWKYRSAAPEQKGTGVNK